MFSLKGLPGAPGVKGEKVTRLICVYSSSCPADNNTAVLLFVILIFLFHFSSEYFRK